VSTRAARGAGLHRHHAGRADGYLRALGVRGRAPDGRQVRRHGLDDPRHQTGACPPMSSLLRRHDADGGGGARRDASGGSRACRGVRPTGPASAQSTRPCGRSARRQRPPRCMVAAPRPIAGSRGSPPRPPGR